jgi:hypothetical protein
MDTLLSVARQACFLDHSDKDDIARVPSLQSRRGMQFHFHVNFRISLWRPLMGLSGSDITAWCSSGRSCKTAVKRRRAAPQFGSPLAA